MDKFAKLAETLKASAGNGNIPLIIGTVKSVEGDKCTVTYGDDANPVDLEDVRLKTTIGTGENYLLVTPKIGSSVVLGSITGNYEDLSVLKIDEAEKIELLQNGLNVLVDSNDSKVSVKNNKTSLVDLFSQLVQILQQLKVYTPAGPSGTPLPDTITRVQKFENDFKQLLK
jgi:hypothetical protein